MVRFETQPVRVKRPLEEVFAYVSNLDKQAEWSNAVLESRQEGFGQIGSGTRYRTKIKFLGRTIEGLSEVSDYAPDRRIEFTSITGPMPYKWDLVVEASDGGTVVNSHGEAEPSGLFKLAAPAMKGAFKRQAESDLQTLKAILEEGS